MNTQDEVKSTIDKPISDAEKFAAKNDVFEAYGLKIKRCWKKLVKDKLVEVSEAEAKADYLVSDDYKKMVQLMEHDASFKEMMTHTCNWFNEIKLMNAIEWHYSCGCVATRAHRNTDISLIDVFTNKTAEVAKSAGIELDETKYGAAKLSCRYVLMMTPSYVVI